MGALHRAAALAGHAVAASRVGEPQVLHGAQEDREQWVGREKAQAQEWWSWQSPLPTKLGPPGHKHMDIHHRHHQPNPRSARLFASSWLTCRPWPPRLGLVRACRGEMPPMPEGLRRPILPGGRARGGIGNCRWVRRATPIPTEPAMGSEFEPNAQL